MKKILICIAIVAAIIMAIFIYKNFIKDNNEASKGNEVVLNDEGNFLLYIEDILQENERIKIKGNILSGKINTNDEISIVGLGRKGIDTKIVKLEINNKEVTSAKVGDLINITLEPNVKKEYMEKGQAVIISGSTKPIYNIDAQITSTELEISEIKEKGNVFFINSDIKCSISIVSEEDKQIKIKLDVPIVVEQGLEFVIKNHSSTIARGIIK